MKSPVIICVALAVVAAGLLGFFAGRSSIKNEMPPEKNHTTKTETAKSRKAFQSVAELRAELRRFHFARFSSLQTAKEWGVLAERLEASDTEVLLEEMMMSPSFFDKKIISSLITILAEKRPDVAWKLVLKAPSGLRAEYAAGALRTLAKNSPDTALEKLKEYPNKTTRKHLKMSIVQVVAKSDPQRALTMLGKPERYGEETLREIFDRWVKKDAVAAAAAISQVDPFLQPMVRGELLDNLAKTDPKTAWDMAIKSIADLNAVHIDNYYSDARSRVIRQWIRKDPQSAIAALNDVADVRIRRSLLQNILELWIEQDFDAAFQTISTSSNDEVLRIGLMFLAVNPNKNYKKILDAILDSMPPGEPKDGSISTLFSNWASDNPQAAAAAVAELAPGVAPKDAIEQIASQWFFATEDPTVPLRWLNSLPAGTTRSNALRNFFWVWSNSDPQAALNAASQLDENDRESVLTTVAEIWATQYPKAALAWAATLTDVNLKENVMSNAISTMVYRDPVKGSDALAIFPAGNALDNLTSKVVRTWFYMDIAASTAWVRTLPEGSARDRACATLSSLFAEKNPTTALDWAAAISNDSQRNEATKEALRTWKKYDPVAAKAWVSRSDLSKEIKESILK